MSRLLLLTLALITALAVFAIAVLDMPLLLRALGVAGVLVFSGVAFMRHAGPRGICALRLLPEGEVEAHTRAGAALRFFVQPDSTVLGPLVVLRLRAKDGARRALVVLPDAMEIESRRQLGIWLRWKVLWRKDAR